jgi:hypothetical protein
MAKPTVADQFISTLWSAGARRIYGVVGDSLNPVVDAVRRHEGMDWAPVRHEEAGAFAAKPAEGVDLEHADRLGRRLTVRVEDPADVDRASGRSSMPTALPCSTLPPTPWPLWCHRRSAPSRCAASRSR